MNTLVEMTELAARVLREHPEAPRVVNVSVGTGTKGGWVAEFQLYGGATTQQMVTAVAGWATVLGAVVSVIDHDRYVEISAYATVDGCAVRAWNHLHGREVADLASATRVNIYGTRTEFDPAVLLAAFTAGAVA